MAQAYTCRPRLGFTLKELAPADTLLDYNEDFCTLQNRNLFDVSGLIFKPVPGRMPDHDYEQGVFEAMEPAFLLLSRIILRDPQSFAIFVSQKQVETRGSYPIEAVEVPLSDEEIISMVQRWIPRILVDSPVIRASHLRLAYAKGAKCYLGLEYNLAKTLVEPHTSQDEVLVQFAIAVAVGHHIALCLENQRVNFVPGGRVGIYSVPPGLLGHRAGTAWEVLAFGGKLHVLREDDGTAFPRTIAGFAIQAPEWDLQYMKIDIEWIRALFTEEHWNKPDGNPLWPPLSLCAIFPRVLPGDDPAGDRAPDVAGDIYIPRTYNQRGPLGRQHMRIARSSPPPPEEK